jgi:hypothetical protein
MRVMAAESAVQFLYASYTPPMLGVPGDVSLVHVRRTRRGIELRSLDPRALGATDAEIKELGLDRGELLAFYRAVLFVEGETDKAVLEELYADRLRDIGLLVQPFRGANKVEKIVEAEMLLRVMGPRFTYWSITAHPRLWRRSGRSTSPSSRRRSRPSPRVSPVNSPSSPAFGGRRSKRAATSAFTRSARRTCQALVHGPRRPRACARAIDSAYAAPCHGRYGRIRTGVTT